MSVHRETRASQSNMLLIPCEKLGQNPQETFCEKVRGFINQIDRLGHRENRIQKGEWTADSISSAKFSRVQI